MIPCSFRCALKVFNVKKQGKIGKEKQTPEFPGPLHKSKLDKKEGKKKPKHSLFFFLPLRISFVLSAAFHGLPIFDFCT